MAKCWQERGCDDEMMQECLHFTKFMDRCPSKCAFAGCSRPTYELTIAPELVFSIEVDRDDAIKENCLYCAFFLKNGPRL